MTYALPAPETLPAIYVYRTLLLFNRDRFTDAFSPRVYSLAFRYGDTL
jgi:hypothetical protein